MLKSMKSMKSKLQPYLVLILCIIFFMFGMFLDWAYMMNFLFFYICWRFMSSLKKYSDLDKSQSKSSSGFFVAKSTLYNELFWLKLYDFSIFLFMWLLIVNIKIMLVTFMDLEDMVDLLKWIMEINPKMLTFIDPDYPDNMENMMSTIMNEEQMTYMFNVINDTCSPSMANESFLMLLIWKWKLYFPLRLLW